MLAKAAVERCCTMRAASEGPMPGTLVATPAVFYLLTRIFGRHSERLIPLTVAPDVVLWPRPDGGSVPGPNTAE